MATLNASRWVAIVPIEGDVGVAIHMDVVTGRPVMVVTGDQPTVQAFVDKLRGPVSAPPAPAPVQ